MGAPHPKPTFVLSPTLGFPHCSHLAYFAGKRAGGREGSPGPHVVPHPELLARGNSSRFSEGSKVLWGFLSRFFCLFLESTSGLPSSSSSRARLLRAPLLGWLPSLGLGGGQGDFAGLSTPFPGTGQGGSQASGHSLRPEVGLADPVGNGDITCRPVPHVLSGHILLQDHRTVIPSAGRRCGPAPPRPLAPAWQRSLSSRLTAATPSRLLALASSSRSCRCTCSLSGALRARHRVGYPPHALPSPVPALTCGATV